METNNQGNTDSENKINSLWDAGQDIQMKSIELLNAENGVDTVMEGVYNSSNGKPGPSQCLGKEVV
jgi:hypothetical protein